jgi:hypothetical protein
MHRLRPVLALIVLTGLFISGCAGLSFERIRRGLESGHDRGHYIEGVPFVMQKGRLCGPAALSSVLRFYGIDCTQDDIASGIYSEKARGTANVLMVTEAKKRGLWTDPVHRGDLLRLQRLIDEDFPVIVFIEADYIVASARHYMVVVGYDRTREAVIVHDGYTTNKVIGFSEFRKCWSARKKWYLAACLPERIPSWKYVELGLQAEKNKNTEKARSLYTRAMEKTRSHHTRAIAAANLARLAILGNEPVRASELLYAAKGIFETFFMENPGAIETRQTREAYARCLNTLAWTLGVMLNDRDAALRLIDKALELFPANDDFQDTRKRILEKKNLDIPSK